jgi:arabinose-5-phosphate isomerase
MDSPRKRPRTAGGICAEGRDGSAAAGAPRPDLALARRIIETEAEGLRGLAERLDEAFAAAAEAVFACPGTVILTGIGKAGIVARKVSATLASTGSPSIFLHPVEALHGDLGRLRRGDVVIALSNSGRTEELLRLTDHLKARGARLIAVTADGESALAGHADIALCYGEVVEACPMGLAPTASTTCMLALGDALALTVMRMRDFRPEEFAAFHPGGDLGRRLLRVEEAMTARAGERLPIAPDNLSVREVLERAERIPRRAGAVLLTDADGRLTGIFTDADLRRRLLDEGEALLARPVSEVMIGEPMRIAVGSLASEALAMMNQRRIDELPVVDDAGRPVGLLDVQDLISLTALGQGT